MTITALISLGKRVLDPDNSIEVQLELLTRYVAEFSSLIGEEGGRVPEPATETDRREMHTLAEIHADVLDVAQTLLGETSEELKGLRIRGKAILAYTDTMPKQISLSSKKKG